MVGSDDQLVAFAAQAGAGAVHGQRDGVGRVDARGRGKGRALVYRPRHAAHRRQQRGKQRRRGAARGIRGDGSGVAHRQGAGAKGHRRRARDEGRIAHGRRPRRAAQKR